MSFHEVMGFTAGVLQFIVAGYALRLNRLFGTTRVGWSLFGAFSLLAILHLVQSLTPSTAGAEFGVKIEVIYSLISLMLLTGMTHIESLLKERMRMEQMEKNLRAELESQVKEKTAHLTKAVEELQLEIEQRKRMESEVEKTHKELLAASRQAGMAEIAISVLHNVGNMLQSVNTSASLVFDQVKQSKIANVVRVGNLIRDHSADLGDFMKNDPRGKKLPAYIAQLAEHLSNEQVVLSNELESLRKNIHEVLAIQRSYVKISDVTDRAKPTVSVEDPPDMNGHTLTKNDVQNLTFLDAPLVISG
jgi:C4-dicarboxylate-specific signal transduction histidine kinase